MARQSHQAIEQPWSNRHPLLCNAFLALYRTLNTLHENFSSDQQAYRTVAHTHFAPALDVLLKLLTKNELPEEEPAACMATILTAFRAGQTEGGHLLAIAGIPATDGMHTLNDELTANLDNLRNAYETALGEEMAPAEEPPAIPTTPGLFAAEPFHFTPRTIAEVKSLVNRLLNEVSSSTAPHPGAGI